MHAGQLSALLLGFAMHASASPADDFRQGLGAWRVEAEPGAKVSAGDGVLEIDSPGGTTLWFNHELQAPVRIEFEVLAVARGGINDAVSDVNAFWMAHEVDGSAPRPRSGMFEAYDTLRTYYVGIGGNRNRTTRMRRYVARRSDRPLLPQHNRTDAAALLRPNRWMRVALVADGRRAAVERDGRVLFTLQDPEPYRRGWFALRTTKSHLKVRRLRIVR